MNKSKSQQWKPLLIAARAMLAYACIQTAFAQIPENLVVEGVPAVTPELKAHAGRYLEFRAAGFQSWHPVKREMIVNTRFADTLQLHAVKFPGGARRQMTFLPEPVSSATWQPKQGRFIVFSQDLGGGEFYQLYRLDPGTGDIILLTDGKSRNSGKRFSRDGERLVYTSTRRNGRDTDLYVMNPAEPATDRLMLELAGGGWNVADWAHDGATLLLEERLSINQGRIYLADLARGTKELLTPDDADSVAWSNARFARDGQSIFLTTDKNCEFHRLARLDLKTKAVTFLTTGIPWDVEEFEPSPDGKIIAFITNEEGAGALRLLDARTGKQLAAPRLPMGIPSGVTWHENGRDLAFNFSSARSPADVFSLDVKTGKTDRWTESETGGLDTSNFVEPELVKLKSFDGLTVSGFLYRPDPKKFPGRRPAIISIHGGPESQYRPGFMARNNYFLNELGVALLCPNVRGSAGYGKTFLLRDNGFKREDSVRDIGAFIDWITRDAGLDGTRIAVMGGSYGGYMTLASMVHYGERLRCGVDIVGISSFLTFLKNTQDYRRDLRRVEYGDERDPAMADFLQRISPLTQVDRIQRPLFVVQGFNDPRVPVTEAGQMVAAIRNKGGSVWYLMAKDEGHGFQKKRNADFQFAATILFLRENLLK